jgi:hypothetical protein
MALEDAGPRLHDRATRGQSLTPEEAAALHAWYAQADQAELALIAPASRQGASLLRQQVDDALAQLAKTPQQIRRLSKENDALRRENARLRAQAVGQAQLQPA